MKVGPLEIAHLSIEYPDTVDIHVAESIALVDKDIFQTHYGRFLFCFKFVILFPQFYKNYSIGIY